MAVPAHDERDYEFAKKMDLPIRYVIDPVTGEPQENASDKNKIVAVVEHEGKILTIHWPDELGGRLLVGGTVNENEDPAATAAREIAEETGYSDLELVERADEMVHHSYYAFSKKQAVIAHTTLLHFKLKSDKKHATKLEADEVGKFIVEWVTPEEAFTEIHDDQHQYALSRFIKHQPYTGDGLLRNSGSFDGRDNREAMADIVVFAGGEQTTQYRLRDWLVSRQRYWGCPIPIVYDPEGKAHPVPAEHLPWLLPTDVDFKPTGKAPLASSKELQERVTTIFGEGWTPEYDTLDTFVDSSWYFLRYLASKDTHDFSDSLTMQKWLPVNRYSGGSEHTTMHLLYARFFTKALYDLALVPVDEPFTERYNRGLIMGPDGQKMSKSKGNVLNPDDFVKEYGADAVRIYLAFIGPYNEPRSYPWNLDGVASMRKFLDRVERLVDSATTGEISDPVAQSFARASQKVAEDSDRFKFNTSVAALMILVNELETLPSVPKAALTQLVTLLAPFAPHLSEHLWEKLGGEGSVHSQSWPAASASVATEQEVVVQVSGKRRGSLLLTTDVSEEIALEKALAIPAVVTALGGAKPKRVVYVVNKILNIVV
jgi:leucyl-tRNA synthetase